MNYMKKIISLVLAVLLIINSLNDCYAAELNKDNFGSYVNSDFIKQYGSFYDNNENGESYFNMCFKKNKSNVEEIAKKIAAGEVTLDKETSHNADSTTAFLKKIYSSENFNFFRKKFKDMGINNNDYFSCWRYVCPVIVSMVDIDIINYILHSNPYSKEIIKNIDNIEGDVRKSMDLYIDSMDITNETKQNMKSILNNTEVIFYGIKNNLDIYFEHINKNDLINDINSDNKKFFNSLSKYLAIPEENEDYVSENILCENIYQPNASAVTRGRYIIIYPSMFLCTETDNKNFDLKTFIYLILSHEFGHIWNYFYIEKDLESRIRYQYPVRTKELNDQSLEDRGYYSEVKKHKKDSLIEICPEDREKLETHAQNIINEFNNVDTKLYYVDEDKEKVSINGLLVFSEAAADNFALNAITCFAKKENRNLAPIFLTFSKCFWGTYNINDFYSYKYPPAPYRVNLGLKLCKNFNEWFKSQI